MEIKLIYCCRRIVFVLLTCLVALTVNGQEVFKGVVSGKITDSVSGIPVEYATIMFYDHENVNIGAAYSLENGTFHKTNLKTGDYRIEISSTGFLLKEIHFTIQENAPTQLLNIYLSTSEKQLDAVIVTGSKKLIEKKPGMLVYVAENDVTNKGGTAADVLRKAPVLSVDAQGNVNMRGNSNIKILIDGKYSGQMARSIADALNMMPADIIKSVEIITNPSAKYDAEGAAGVINIITKKGNKSGSGTIEVSASNWEQMINPRFSFAGNKWSVTFNGHIHRFLSKTDSRIARNTFENGQALGMLDQQVTRKTTAPHGSGDVTVIYQLDSLTEISLGINTWLGNWPNDRVIGSTVRNHVGIVTDQYQQTIDTRAAYLGADFNIGINRKMKRPGQELTMLVQYSPSKEDSRYIASLASNDNKYISGEWNNSNTKNAEWTVQVDYSHPVLRSSIFETGFKAILRSFDNDYNLYVNSAVNPEYIPDPSRSDIFGYTQNVWAGYALAKLNLKKGWHAELGTRLEQTFLEGSFTGSTNSFKNRFTNLIPTATISKKINEEHSLDISYTKRLTRPYIWDLNPNINSSDPKNIQSGNPELDPEIAHQAELSHGWSPASSFFLNSSVFWKRTGNAIINFVRIDSGDVTYTSKQNLASNRVYGVNLSATFKANELLNLNANVNVNHLKYNSEALQILQEGWATDFNINVTQKLPKKYTIQAFGEYNTRVVQLQGHTTRKYYYSFAAKKEISSPQLTITVALINPFANTLEQSTLISTPQFATTTTNRFYNRAFKLTLNWDLGKRLNQKERKKINNNDIQMQGKG